MRTNYLLILFAAFVGAALSWAPTQCGKANQITEWGKKVNPAKLLQEYPRPQLVRGENSWKNLNGLWEFQPAKTGDPVPYGKKLTSEILVPFPVEACLSGIGETYKYLWYRLTFDTPANFKAATTLLHFGAVDWQCSVYLNKQLVGNHTGGYDAFHFDITKHLVATNNELIVYVFDPSNDGFQPHGKQRISAINGPGGDTYTPSSGIWQTVWLENVPEDFVSYIRIDTSLEAVTVNTFLAPGTLPAPGIDWNGGTSLGKSPYTLAENDMNLCASMCDANAECTAWTFGDAQCDGNPPRCWLKSGAVTPVENFCRVSAQKTAAKTVKYQVSEGSKVVATESGTSGKPVTIKIPSPKLWTPDSPYLYNLTIETASETVDSYFGLRTITLGKYNHSATPDTGVQKQTDRAGNDMPGSPFKLASADPELCHQKCISTQGCAAWAYAIPNCDGFTEPTCWLKKTAGGSGPAKCRDSGALASPAFPAARPLLNGEPLFLAGWLDQSWWPDGQYTAPSDEALAFDLRILKEFGLNLIRLHQKVNSARWYWYADSLGIVVFQDAVQKYGGATKATIAPFYDDIQKMILGLHNHPSIVQWTVFNEGDCVGQFNVSSTVDMVQRLDKTRLVDTNSGGPGNDLHIADVNDIHTYPYPGDPKPSATQYGMVGEYGGIGAFIAGKEWVAGKCGTYLKAANATEEANLYITMLKQIEAKKDDISAVVYTQISDVELECDGFLNYDRTNKFDAATMARVVAANKAIIKGTKIN